LLVFIIIFLHFYFTLAYRNKILFSYYQKYLLFLLVICLSLDLAIAGCYDGHVQVINVGHMLGEKLSLADSGGGSNRLDFEAHCEPVRAVCSWVPATSSQSFTVQESGTTGRGRKKTPAAAAATLSSAASVTVCIATGSKDHSVKLWRGLYSPSALSFQPPQLVATLPGSSSVESLAMVTLSQQQRIMFFCGDWSGCLRGWKLPLDLNLEDHSSILDDDTATDGQQKRRKTGSSEAQSSSLPKESFCIKAHTQTLAGVDADAVGEAGQQLLWTCSWDRSLKLWDIERQDCVACFVCPKVATSVQRRGSPIVGDGAGLSREVIATSHTDGKVRLWDSRIGGAAAEDRSVPVSTFGRDSQWISQVTQSSFRRKTMDSLFLIFSALLGSLATGIGVFIRSV
jgi:WD40 repeat protein